MKKKLLIVDDELEITNVIARYFSKKFNVITAPGVSEATLLLNKENFDLIISDYKMQDGTGVDLFNHIKLKNNFILLSGYIEIERASLLKLGIKYLIDKPVNLRTLEKTINELLDTL